VLHAKYCHEPLTGTELFRLDLNTPFRSLALSALLNKRKKKYVGGPALPTLIYWRKISKWSGSPGANILAKKYLNGPALPAQIYWRKISKWSGSPGANILAKNI
jgi:hypothetical protein